MPEERVSSVAMEIIYGTIVAVKYNDELLLLKRMGEDLWEFPKGVFEDVDLTIHTTAERELKEETGIEAKDIKYVGDIKRVEDDRAYIGYAYSVNSSKKKIKLSKEHESYEWVKKRDLSNYRLDENTLLFLRLYKDF